LKFARLLVDVSEKSANHSAVGACAEQVDFLDKRKHKKRKKKQEPNENIDTLIYMFGWFDVLATSRVATKCAELECTSHHVPALA
jgi:hypothetical protein